MWIETQLLLCNPCRRGVTPHTGVWIETKKWDNARIFGEVTPHTGVWIETTTLLIVS